MGVGIACSVFDDDVVTILKTQLKKMKNNNNHSRSTELCATAVQKLRRDASDLRSLCEGDDFCRRRHFRATDLIVNNLVITVVVTVNTGYVVIFFILIAFLLDDGGVLHNINICD
jgi:hypothetical protein